jgi:hypothetical protein
MKFENGIITYKPHEIPQFLRFIEDAPGLKPSRFGCKIAVHEGRLRWEAATEDDYRESESKRLGIKKADVTEPADSCALAGHALCIGGCEISGGLCDLRGGIDHYCGCE